MAGFSSISDGRYLTFGLSCTRTPLSQMEVAEDQNAEEGDPADSDNPTLGSPPGVLEWIPRFKNCVAEKVAQAHVVAVAQQSVELVVDFPHGKGTKVIRRAVGHGPPRMQAQEREPETPPRCPSHQQRIAS
jgi:hypothetical protein